MLDNLFLPLFEVTVNPASHPQLHCFLSQVRCDARNVCPCAHAHVPVCTCACADRAWFHRACRGQAVLAACAASLCRALRACAPPQVVGFDMVDDESKPERRPTKHSPLPQVRCARS
jgi:hypothetical protein